MTFPYSLTRIIPPNPLNDIGRNVYLQLLPRVVLKESMEPYGNHVASWDLVFFHSSWDLIKNLKKQKRKNFITLKSTRKCPKLFPKSFLFTIELQFWRQKHSKKLKGNWRHVRCWKACPIIINPRSDLLGYISPTQCLFFLNSKKLLAEGHPLFNFSKTKS